jgi:hypothetical protein
MQPVHNTQLNHSSRGFSEIKLVPTRFQLSRRLGQGTFSKYF